MTAKPRELQRGLGVKSDRFITSEATGVQRRPDQLVDLAVPG
jgi:hypothetical protein